MTADSKHHHTRKELPPKLYMLIAVAPLVLAALALIGLVVYHHLAQ